MNFKLGPLSITIPPFNVVTFLVITTTCGFFGLLSLLFFKAFPPESKEILNVTIGTVGTAWLGIMTYHFASSAGSARKTELLSKKDEKPNGTP